jgi:tetratricopeptide (TPR) repeat protein
VGRPYWVFGLFALAVTAFAPAVHADDWEACQNSNTEVKIVGCSAIIDRGTDTNENIAIAYYNRGNSYFDKDEHDRAIADYDKAIALDPNHANAYFNRGLAYDSKGEYDRAIKDYDKAIALNPEYAKSYFNRGLAYEKLGDNQKAEADYQKALLLLPGNKAVIDSLRRLKAAP